MTALNSVFRSVFLLLLALSAISFAGTGCDYFIEKKEVGPQVQTKAVQVMEVAASQHPASLNYIGTVEPKELIRYSFKIAGQIKRLPVANGDQVFVGQVLAELDTTDLDFQLATAKESVDSMAASVNKAQEALAYAVNLYERTKSLYEANAVSKDNFEQAELKKNMAVLDYQQAILQHSAAATNFQYQSDLLSNSVIYAEQDGFVAQTLVNEFERVGAYIPALAVRSKAQVINIGIPQQELPYVQLGSAVIVDVDGNRASGLIANLSDYPDAATRTYKAEVSIFDKTFPLGAIVKVHVEIGNVDGIWIPFTAIFSYSGENCVYVIKDGRSLKRTVEIQKLSDDQAMVIGLVAGDLLVVSGMSNLSDGALVNIMNQEQSL
jgi:RND family efflux transporter MFP subunit